MIVISDFYLGCTHLVPHVCMLFAACSIARMYKVWDLLNYNMLYEIEDKQIQEIKIR